MAYTEIHRARMARVMANMEELGLTQLLVTDPASIAWVAGWSTEPGERFMALVLRAGHEPVLVLNDLFPTPADLGFEVLGYRDTDDPLAVVEQLLDHGATLGCDKNMAARFVLPLVERGAAGAFVLGSAALDKARSVKDARELELMRRASAINDEAMAWLRAQVREGVTEVEIATGLLDEYKRLGAQGFSFPPIVSFGAHAADPHHEPDDTPLRPGDVVLFDVGCVLDGYCSDMTRTFFFKSVTEEQRTVYELVRRANEAAAALVAPGVRFCDIDGAARGVIEEAGYGREFTHRLGHQIGTCVHEPGDVSAVNADRVQPGMVFSDEPGVYLAGRWGVRIEDLVAVTEDGHEVLNRFPKDLEVLE